jgi:hypothetical protein
MSKSTEKTWLEIQADSWDEERRTDEAARVAAEAEKAKRRKEEEAEIDLSNARATYYSMNRPDGGLLPENYEKNIKMLAEEAGRDREEARRIEAEEARRIEAEEARRIEEAGRIEAEEAGRREASPLGLQISERSKQINGKSDKQILEDDKTILLQLFKQNAPVNLTDDKINRIIKEMIPLNEKYKEVSYESYLVLFNALYQDFVVSKESLIKYLNQDDSVNNYYGLDKIIALIFNTHRKVGSRTTDTTTGFDRIKDIFNTVIAYNDKHQSQVKHNYNKQMEANKLGLWRDNKDHAKMVSDAHRAYEESLAMDIPDDATNAAHAANFAYNAAKADYVPKFSTLGKRKLGGRRSSKKRRSSRKRRGSSRKRRSSKKRRSSRKRRGSRRRR